jgi:L-alanine-DL-glutamate epimerase-like enolase superfamily enzyme
MPATCSCKQPAATWASIRRQRHFWAHGAIAAIAEAANLKINCGGLAVLSQLEAAAGAHFYASRPTEHVMPAGEFIFGLGVIGPDPIVPETDFVVEDGHVRPPRGPGFGITVDERALDAHTLVKEIVQKAL